MKVLSIKEPWASLIINGYKKYEFRTWPTKYRGDILIHASKSYDKGLLNKFKSLNIDFNPGKIIGIVTITDCLPVTKPFEEKLIKENNLVYGGILNYSGYAFKLENVKKIKPIEAKGQLGFWNYDI